MRTTLKLLLVCCFLVVLNTGCQSRCGNCGPAGLNWFGTAPTRVPAPPTYSLGVPQTAQQQDYYTVPNNNGQATQPTQIPNYQPNLAPQPGWRQSGQGASNTGAGTTFNPTSFTLNAQPVNGVYAGGSAQTFNPNYQSTTTDERLDESRLAVTDASTIRAPARFFPTGNVNRLAQSPVATTRVAQTGFTTPQVAGFSQTQTRVANGPVTINGNFEVQGQTNPAVVNNRIARSFNTPVTSSTSGQSLLAESTTERVNVASNTQAGWRNSQLVGQPNVINR